MATHSADKKSSLQRLLSLDKSFDSFEERIHEAARILGLSLDHQPAHSISISTSISTTSSPSHTARLDFVLRWLLDKLSTQSSARQCLPSWILLRLLIERMPPAVLAKCLSATNPLTTCSQALADVFPSLEASTLHFQDQAESTSKKRKRQSITSHGSPNNAPIFIELTASIRLLLSSSTPSASDAASENRLHALLRLDHADLVRLVKHSLYALLQLQHYHAQFPSLVSSSLSLIQDLSILQPNSSVQSSDISFCSECLWPAALLLCSLHSASSLGDASSQHAQHAIQVLDRFLATHLFVPARVAYYSESSSTKKKRPQTELPGLVERLSSLRSQFTLNSERSGSTQKSQPTTAYECIPLLFDLAIRCSPVATPKQRIAEASWIQLLFTSLVDVFTTSGPTMDPTVVNQTIGHMLDVLSRNSLTLESDILVRLLDQQSGLALSISAETSRKQPDFALIARILDMDTSIFTDVNTVPARALFEALTSYGRDENMTKTKSGSAVSSFDSHAIFQNIAISLMQAYARSRELPAFLEQWFICLSSQVPSSSSGWFLWTDSILADSLRGVLETSLTSSQIGDLIDLRRENLSQSVSSESGAAAQAFASIVLLNAIASSLKSDATIDALAPRLEALLLAVEDEFSKFSNLGDLVSSHLINLCSQIYLLWYPIWSSSSTMDGIEARNAQFLNGPITRFATSKVNSCSSIQDGSSMWTVDSAFVLVSSVCDMQRRLPGHEAECTRLFCSAVLPTSKDMSSCYAAQRPSAFLAVLTEFPDLLLCVPAAEGAQLFAAALTNLSNEHGSKSVLTEFLNAFFTTADLSSKDDLFSSVCCLTEQFVAPTMWLDILLQWPLKGLSRQQREKILDIIVSFLTQVKFTGTDKQQALELVVSLFEVPNATAKLSTEPSVLWALAELPFDQSELSAFEDICKSLLRHIMDTKEQDRSRSYISQLSTLVSTFVGKQKNLGSSMTLGKTCLSSVFLAATEARLQGSELSDLAHRQPSIIDSFVKRLSEALSDALENKLGNDESLQRLQYVVETFIGIPESVITCGGPSSKKYVKRISDKVQGLLDNPDDIPLSVLIQCFEQLSSTMFKQDPSRMCESAERLLVRDMNARQYRKIIDPFENNVRSIPEDDKISFVGRLIPGSGEIYTTERMVLVRSIILTIQDSQRKQRDSDTDSASILVRLLGLLSTCSEYDVHQQLVACVVTVLRDQPILVTQYSAELTIATVTALASPSCPLQQSKQASPVYEGLCTITQSLMQFHRASLGGRFHLLVPLMQRLLACLFVPASKDLGTANRFKHPVWLDTADSSLNTRHAQRYSRLLENLCNPPQSNITVDRGKTSKTVPGLVDETRKARVHVAQHVPHILHYFCSLILHGRLKEGMRDALMPGMWAIIDVAEMGADDSRGVKALSASMGNADRAVLRGIWEDWRRFGGAWKG